MHHRHQAIAWILDELPAAAAAPAGVVGAKALTAAAAAHMAAAAAAHMAGAKALAVAKALAAAAAVDADDAQTLPAAVVAAQRVAAALAALHSVDSGAGAAAHCRAHLYSALLLNAVAASAIRSWPAAASCSQLLLVQL
jgi:hypothetical protein